MYMIGGFAGLFILFFITRPFTVLFHEMGHALPALLFTEEVVEVYLGTYGNTRKSWLLSVGRLHFYIRKNPFWPCGMVRHYGTDSVTKRLVIIVMGAVFSLLLSILCCWIIFHFDIHGALKLLGVVLLVSCCWDFYINLLPDKYPTILEDGKRIFNDGKNFQYFWQLLPYREVYRKAIVAEKNGNREAAINLYLTIIEQIPDHRPILRTLENLLLQTKDYEQLDQVYEKLNQYAIMNSNDYTNMGFVKSMTDRREEALKYYEQAIYLDEDNVSAMNNRGYYYLINEEYDKALPDFELAIIKSPQFAFAYNNRGLARIKLGDETGGLADIERSKQLKPNNSYLYKNLGIYEFDKGNYQLALAHFQRAKEMDANTYDVDRWIMDTKNKFSKTV